MIRTPITIANSRRYSVLLLLLIPLIGCSEANVPNSNKPIIHPIKVASISDLNKRNIKHFPAKISANREVEASFQVAGRLTTFAIKPGDEVSKGELLASVDERDFVNELALKTADYRLAVANFERIELLLDKKMISQADYDQAKAQLVSTQAQMRLYQDRVKDTNIYAPFSGQVAETYVENFQYIQPQQAILSLQSTDILDVIIQLPESLLINLQTEKADPDYHPTLTLGAAHQHSYQVTYKQHSTTVNPGTQSYEVIFSLPNPKDLTLYPGMAATLEVDFDQLIPNQHPTHTVQVPLTAVLTDDQSKQAQIWVLDQHTNTLSPRVVSIGEISGQQVTISGDVNHEDVIATAGLNRLYKGIKVKPLMHERGL
ncbi:efflux RND transporter periplasmic adaptor subunit [Shewanella youngdeokensis]|uniref:Efflux RND transporter periplasmic adaptor subunit n=1 Tax=Shewanella youngdeokensis TaxID=2999068 RepID=A0ABZ0K4A3_9GAMM|nr:efflux RND transporter periplasmic adaptor subunit [Shewanella sp. DAU334]